MKGQELQKRVSGLVRLNKELHIGFGNLYTRLGKKALSKTDGKTMVGSVMGNQRTFCNLPKKESKHLWHEAINDEAGDETMAHMCKPNNFWVGYANSPSYVLPKRQSWLLQHV